jgi:hypothetical protein
MPIKPPPPPGHSSSGMSFESLSSVSRRAKETMKRLRMYLRGRRAVDLESLVVDAQTLTPRQWYSALPEPRKKARLIYLEPSMLEQLSVSSEDPFETVYGRELLSRLEALLPPEQLPYLDAFLADEKPKELARRMGISAKAASARMRRFKAKIVELYGAIRIE